MAGRRGETVVVDEKWQRIPPDAVNLLFFAHDHQRNARQRHFWRVFLPAVIGVIFA